MQTRRMTTYRTQEPPAAGAVGPKPRFFKNHPLSHCKEIIKKDGVHGPSRGRQFCLSAEHCHRSKPKSLGLLASVMRQISKPTPESIRLSLVAAICGFWGAAIRSRFKPAPMHDKARIMIARCQDTEVVWQIDAKLAAIPELLTAWLVQVIKGSSLFRFLWASAAIPPQRPMCRRIALPFFASPIAALTFPIPILGARTAGYPYSH